MRRQLTIGVLAALAVSAIAASAPAQEQIGPALVGETELGRILVGPNGMTLYSYDNDVPGQPPPRMGLAWIAGVSNCYDECADNWPPFWVEDPLLGGGPWFVTRRRDSTRQWAYLGQLLYYHSGDAEPGDVNGDGLGGVWHVVPIVER